MLPADDVLNPITVGEFRQLVDAMVQDRQSLAAYSQYLRNGRPGDKSLREEYFAILAAIDFKNIPDHETIQLGGETGVCDAEITPDHLFEIVQALPTNEHTVRLEMASGSASDFTYWKHANDHMQFPQAIIDAIDQKHKKRYSDRRILIVVFDGDYSFEDDRVVARWVECVRKNTTCGNFKEILLFERARRKIFTIF